MLADCLVAGALTAFVRDKKEGFIMLRYAIVFFIIALIAALFGFTGIAAGAVEIAKILFFVFVLLAVVSLVMGFSQRK